MGKRARIGLFGGAFSPIHHGHLRLADAAQRALALDELRWLPTPSPPHRTRPAISFDRRARWVELAIADRPGWTVDRREQRREGPSYTVDTVAELRAEYPDAALFLVLGADAFAGFLDWHEWRRIAGLAVLAVGRRPGSPAPEQAPAAGRIPRCVPESPPSGGEWTEFEAETPDLSSSAIRRQLEYGQDVSTLIPDVVYRDIRDDERQLLSLHD